MVIKDLGVKVGILGTRYKEEGGFSLWGPVGCVCVYMCVYMCVCAQVCVHKCMCVHKCVCVRTSICVCHRESEKDKAYCV